MYYKKKKLEYLKFPVTLKDMPKEDGEEFVDWFFAWIFSPEN